MFKELGWDVHEEKTGGIDKAVRNPQELYLHPDSFSGVVDEAGIQFLQEHLAKAQTSAAMQLTGARNTQI